jgi:hypothetical protein
VVLVVCLEMLGEVAGGLEALAADGAVVVSPLRVLVNCLFVLAQVYLHNNKQIEYC